LGWPGGVGLGLCSVFLLKVSGSILLRFFLKNYLRKNLIDIIERKNYKAS